MYLHSSFAILLQDLALAMQGLSLFQNSVGA